MPAEWFEEYKIAILGIQLLAIVGLEIGQLVGGRSSSAAFVATAAPSASTLAKVYVSGEVNSPDVFQFTPGARVEHAIELAGGATSDANLDQINLAILLVDEQHVFVPADESERSVPALIDLNKAEVRELTTLEGIGTVSAEKLIAYRRVNGLFRTMDDLLAAGLTRSQVEKIGDRILLR